MLAASSDKYSTEIILSHDEAEASEGEIYLGSSAWRPHFAHVQGSLRKKGPKPKLPAESAGECVTLVFGETEKHLRQDAT